MYFPTNSNVCCFSAQKHFEIAPPLRLRTETVTSVVTSTVPLLMVTESFSPGTPLGDQLLGVDQLPLPPFQVRVTAACAVGVRSSNRFDRPTKVIVESNAASMRDMRWIILVEYFISLPWGMRSQAGASFPFTHRLHVATMRADSLPSPRRVNGCAQYIPTGLKVL